MLQDPQQHRPLHRLTLLGLQKLCQVFPLHHLQLMPTVDRPALPLVHPPGHSSNTQTRILQYHQIIGVWLMPEGHAFQSRRESKMCDN